MQITSVCINSVPKMWASPLDVPPYWANAQIMDLPTPNEKKGALAIVDGKGVSNTLFEADK